jgi:hypothetical protein
MNLLNEKRIIFSFLLASLFCVVGLCLLLSPRTKRASSLTKKKVAVDFFAKVENFYSKHTSPDGRFEVETEVEFVFTAGTKDVVECQGIVCKVFEKSNVVAILCSKNAFVNELKTIILFPQKAVIDSGELVVESENVTYDLSTNFVKANCSRVSQDGFLDIKSNKCSIDLTGKFVEFNGGVECEIFNLQKLKDDGDDKPQRFAGKYSRAK